MPREWEIRLPLIGIEMVHFKRRIVCTLSLIFTDFWLLKIIYKNLIIILYYLTSLIIIYQRMSKQLRRGLSQYISLYITHILQQKTLGISFDFRVTKNKYVPTVAPSTITDHNCKSCIVGIRVY